MIPKSIVFFGPDGSGKSTQADLLVESLRSQGFKVKKIWIRSPHTFAYLLSRFLLFVGFSRIVTNPYGRQMKVPALYKSRAFQILWPSIELISVLPLILFRLYIPRIMGFTIVAERCVPDTIVNISYYIRDPNFHRSLVAKILLGFLPQGTLSIFLDSDYATIKQRLGHNVEPQDFIEFQRMEYKTIGCMLEAKTINTSKFSIQQIHLQILGWLEAD